MKTKHLVNPTATYTKAGSTVTTKVNQIKSAWKKAKTHLSLKAFARECMSYTDSPHHEPARRWLLNKKANPSAPQKGIGRTHKPKAGQKKNPQVELGKKR